MAQSLSHPEARTPHAPDSPDPFRHVPGTMDISQQERTFEGFIRFTRRMSILIVVALVLLALINA